MTDTEIFTLGSVGVLNTADGLDVLAEGLLGKEILFTRVALGDGELTAESDEQYREKVLNLHDIIKWRIDLPIAKMENRGNGQVLLNAVKDNADIADGFFAREIAVYAINPRTGREVLYSYRNSGDYSSFIPGNTGVVAKMINVGIVTVIQNAKNVNAIIDASFAYTSAAEFKSHVESEHPHLNIPNHYDDVTDATAIWAAYNDNHLHKISIDNLKQIISSDEKSCDEVKLLIAEKELGLDSNVLIIDESDEFSCKVVSCAKGGRLIGVDSVNGIVIGGCYWIADGVNQELVQVKGVGYGTDYYRLTLEQALTYDYNDAKLYRTTFTLGSCDKKSVSWQPNTTFGGIEANLEREIFATDKSGVKVMGDGIFTAEGFMTLKRKPKEDYNLSDGDSLNGGIEYETITEQDVDDVMAGRYDDLPID